MQNGSCGGRPTPIAPGLHPLGYSLYPPLYLPRRLGPGGLRERSPPGTARGPRREERSPLARPGDQPTEGRGRAGRGRGRPGGSRRGFGAEGPGGSPPWRGGRAVRPTRSCPRASPRTECRSRPSRPRRGRSEASGGPGRRRSDGRRQSPIGQGQRSRGPGGHGGEATPLAAGRSPGASAVRSQRPPLRGPGAEGGSRCAGGRCAAAYL